MYKIVLVGNGDYSNGVLSALDILIGKNENMIAMNSADNPTHVQLERNLTAILEENDEVLIFADLNGGMHHQCAAKIILEKRFSSKHIVICEAPLGLMVELSMKFLFMSFSESEQESIIEDAIQRNKEKIMFMNSRMVEG